MGVCVFVCLCHRFCHVYDTAHSTVVSARMLPVSSKDHVEERPEASEWLSETLAWGALAECGTSVCCPLVMRGEIDVTAELPTHFAESLAGLGFEAMAGDMMPLDSFTPPTREEKKAKARAHAKSVRKERRGERRGRGADDTPRGGGSGGGRPRSGSRAGSAPARPAGSRGGAPRGGGAPKR